LAADVGCALRRGHGHPYRTLPRKNWRGNANRC
jgi:hypothetical protein